MMTNWRDEFDRAIIDRNKAVRDAIEWKARAEAAAAEFSHRITDKRPRAAALMESDWKGE